jgi:hypothetical protein
MLQERCALACDFEVDDALAKLKADGLATEEAGVYTAVPIKQVLAKLDNEWDNYYNYN